MEYVFFSGGFDSTAFLLECLFVKKVRTTPIVVTTPGLDGKMNDWEGRQNHKFEALARQNIYNFISNQTNEVSILLQPEITINNVELSNKIVEAGKLAFVKGIYRRPIKQVHYFSQIMEDLNIEGNVLGTFDDNTTNSSPLLQYVDKLGNVNVEKAPKYLKFWKPYKLPYLYQTKKQILERAIKYNYVKALYGTWSCFFPVAGRPCGECEMCKGRIIDTNIKLTPDNI